LRVAERCGNPVSAVVFKAKGLTANHADALDLVDDAVAGLNDLPGSVVELIEPPVPEIMANTVLYVHRSQFRPGELEQLLQYTRQIYGREVMVDIEDAGMLAIRPAV
jgi:hypothetical protein